MRTGFLSLQIGKKTIWETIENYCAFKLNFINTTEYDTDNEIEITTDTTN